MRIVLIIVATVAVAGLMLWLWTPDKSRAELDARYLRETGDMMNVAGAALHVRDSGPRDAPAVILLHGFGSSLHTWEAWAEALSARFRVIRFDLPGTGLSHPDALGDYSDARSMAVLNALMDRSGLTRATLIGHSMGGRIAWNFAAQYSGRVEKLVLVAPDGFASQGFAYDTAPKVSAMVKLMRYVLPRALLKMSLVPAYADPSRLSEDTITRYHDLMRSPGGREALIARMEQLRLTDPTPRLRSITAPTLLLWGDRDAMIPVAHAKDYEALLPTSSTVVLPGVGHIPHEETPDISVRPVFEFLGRS